MKAKLICLLAVLTIITSFFLSCSKDSPTGVEYIDTATFKYPFTIGSTWSYTRVNSVVNVRPDSIKYRIDTTNHISTGTITISHDTTINGVPVRCFIENCIQDTTTWQSRTYYANYDSGLVCYGYRATGSHAGFPFSPSPKIKFILNDNVYNSIEEIFIAYGMFSNPKFSSYDSLYLENPPVNCLKYPISVGLEWFFKRINNNTYIHKKYLGFENVMVNNNQISCVKTERKWFGSGFSSIDYLYDYHSKYGQMKRDYYLKDVIVMNEFGISIGLMDIRDVIDVTSYNIMEP